MCGIVGLCSRRPVETQDTLASMRDALSHRGPDDAGMWWSSDRSVGLAHRRLAILDLSPAGHQPMADSSGRRLITFNGEIYNHDALRDELRAKGHAFRSRSDTEVILAAYEEWGARCLDHFVGAFALGIYDESSRELFLARDRAGEKPLFYYAGPDVFLFGSELKALMADPRVPRRLNVDALDHYLAYGYVGGENVILRDIRKLPPGHAMVYRRDSQDIRVWRYWDLPANRPDQSASVDDLLGELQRLLSDSVRRQLAAADVPVGVLLSGGLDSSLITAIAARSGGAPVKTFTVSFPGHGSMDEAPYARLVADHFGTEHHELVAEPASVSLLPELARQWDEPLADHSIVPSAMLSRVVRKSVTVALGGDGGDELFGGYPHYNFLSTIARVKRLVPRPLRQVGAAAAARFLPVGTRGRNHIIGLADGMAQSIAAIDMYFDSVSRSRLLSPLYANGHRPLSAEATRARHYDASISVYQNASRTDFRTTMVDDYLVKTDRASMLHALELRAPFLDRDLVEFAFGRVPDHLKVAAGERKILLRMLAKRLLPAQLDLERKQGFSLPLRAWFKGEWGAFMESVLEEADQEIFDRAFLRQLVRGQRNGLANTERIFAVAMFELWRREYKVAL